MPRHEPNDEGPPREGRPRPSGRELRRLIRAAYTVSLPYFLVFLAGLVLVTWVFATFVF